MADPVSRKDEDAALKRRRRGRNWALLGALLAISLLFYAIAMVKMGAILKGGTP
jgi:hypothetical protein